MNKSERYFGIIKWYNKQKEFGVLQCHKVGDAGFKVTNLKNADDISKISKNVLVMFNIKQTQQGRYFAENITFDYFQFVVTNYTKFDNETQQVILSYAENETKTKLQELLQDKNNQKDLISEEIPAKDNLDFLDTVLRNNSKEFNANLIKTLVEGLGIVKTENAFNSAKQLFHYNNQIEGSYLPDFPHFIYQKSNNHFRFRLWLEGFVDFCNLEVIKNKFNRADDTLKSEILKRCNSDEKGFLVTHYEQANKNEVEQVYFEGIRDIILQEISQAKENIFVAVAWFTNHHFLDALCEKVKQGVNVEIIILNDYINNWIEGLDFQKFIDLGKEAGNSKFYFCGSDNIMHHKFCIIDSKILFNGSYNWTYYAEHRNSENCMLLKNKPTLINEFIEEFNRLKNRLELVETIIPIDRESVLIHDLFSARQYRSKDLEFQAKEVRKTNDIGRSSRLIKLSLQVNPENDEALKFQKQIEKTDETTIKNQAIDNALKQKQREQAELQRQIEQQKEQLRLKEQEERERQLKEQLEKQKRQEELARQEAEKRRLIKQEEELKAKKDLEEKEKKRLLEIEQRKKELEAQQRKEEAQRAEQERIRVAEQKRQEDEKRRQAQIFAQKQAEQQRIKEEAELLANSKKTDLQGKRGKLRINLQWKSFDDLDLHVYDPADNHIFYNSKQATCQDSLGQLDVDANAGSGQTKTPQENIYWDSEAPEGTYKVEVNHYAYRELSTCPFVLTIIPEFGEPKVYTGRVVGEKSTVTVATFSYNKKEGLKILSSI